MMDSTGKLWAIWGEQVELERAEEAGAITSLLCIVYS
jgi:hypothetical protein